jgi:hypothetical protein
MFAFSRVYVSQLYINIHLNLYSSLSFLVSPPSLDPANVYKTVPTNTILAPKPNSLFHPFPNHQTLMHKLSAFRVVRTRLVVTEDTVWQYGQFLGLPLSAADLN